MRSICDGFHGKALAFQHIAEEFPVKIVVLDNEYSLCHLQSRPPNALLDLLYAQGKTLTILRDSSSPGDPQALALGALGWLLQSESRAERLLSLTGLTPEALRGGLGDPAVLGAVLDFLAAHEPDLVGAAEALGVTPATLAQAAERLDR